MKTENFIFPSFSLYCLMPQNLFHSEMYAYGLKLLSANIVENAFTLANVNMEQQKLILSQKSFCSHGKNC